MSNLNLATVSAKNQTYKQMSSKYVVMDTEKLCNYLLGLTSKGSPVFELRQIINSKSKKAGAGKHIVRLRVTKSYEINGEILYPELLIMNSHDGSCPLRVEMGVYRLVCTNGLVVKSKDFGEIKIRHMGTPEEAAFEIVKQFAGNLPKFAEAQRTLAEKIMSDDEIIDFAMKAAQIRWSKSFTKEDAAILLEVARPEDEGNSAWTVLNRVQEKLLNGGYKLSGQKRTSKSIRRADEDVRINSQLFELAAEYCQYEMV